MTEQERIVGYVDTSRKEDIERAAEREDLSVSKWLAEAAKEKLRNDEFENLVDRYAIEDRIAAMVGNAADQVSEDLEATIREAVREAVREELGDGGDTPQKDSDKESWGQ